VVARGEDHQPILAQFTTKITIQPPQSRDAHDLPVMMVHRLTSAAGWQTVGHEERSEVSGGVVFRY
jgi:hypothetical protein